MSVGKTYTRSGASEEDQCAKVRSALVAQSAGGVDQRSNTVSLHGASNQRAAPGGGSTGGFLGLDKLLLRVGRLGTVVGVTEDWGEDAEGGSVGEEGTHRNSGGLHRGKV